MTMDSAEIVEQWGSCPNSPIVLVLENVKESRTKTKDDYDGGGASAHVGSHKPGGFQQNLFSRAE